MASARFQEAWPSIRFDVLDSTNEEARRRAISGDLGPCWLIAERQTAGRGRLGRQWESPPGNFFGTALFAFPESTATAALTSFAAGLAVIDAIGATGTDTASLRLKWPNDVLADKAKLAGILVETMTVQGQLVMAAGFGVNVSSAPDVPRRETTCLAGLPGAEGVSGARLAVALDAAFRGQLSTLLTAGFEVIRRDWLARAAHLGARIAAPQGGTRVEGVMQGLSEDGALIIRQDDGMLTHVRAGEISVFS